MSRSNPRDTGTTSPVRFYFKFNAKEGNVSYYDKEKKEDVKLDSLTFVVLDKRSSITGWNDADNSSVYSNYVQSTKNEELTVKTSKRTVAKGLYETFKNDMDDFGGDFTTNLFLITKIGKDMVMGVLQLSRSGMKGWMDFESTKPDIYGHTLTITKGSQEKKGSNKYFLPAFELGDLSKELEELATEKDKELQSYFKGVSGTPVSNNENTEKEDEEDDLPF